MAKETLYACQQEKCDVSALAFRVLTDHLKYKCMVTKVRFSNITRGSQPCHGTEEAS